MQSSLNQIPNMGRLLRPNDVAEILSVSKSYVYKLIRDGAIPSIQIGRSVRVRDRDLMVFIDERAQTNQS